MEAFLLLAVLVLVYAAITRVRAQRAPEDDGDDPRPRRTGRAAVRMTRSPDLPSGPHNWTTLVTRPEREAYVLAGFLESGGIPVFRARLPSEYLATTMADQLRTSVVLSVPAEHLDEARRLVAELDAT